MNNSSYVDYEDLKASSKHKSEYIRELQQQNHRYKQALEFYANEDNWIYGKVQHIVRGEKARQALEEESE
jgi:hypothetical protein